VKPKQKNSGFTLIEVMVAISIFAVLSFVGYKGISALIQTKERVEVEDSKWQQLIVFFDRFELDVKQSVNRPIRSREDTIEPAWFGRPSFSEEDGAQLSFSRFGDPEQSGFLMDTRRVGYRLNGGAVELLIWPSLDVAPSAKPEVFSVLPHVAEMNFSYLSADGRWLSHWPELALTSEATNSQPKYFSPTAVQLMIKLDTGEIVTRIFAL
jgi:general secretion pathway protein J